MLSQSLSTQVLRSHLEKYHVAVESSTELVSFTQDSVGVEVKLAKLDDTGARISEETLIVPWLIGTDGARGKLFDPKR